MDVGKIFSAENDIYAYSSLGIGRLIYQLPIPLCKMFIKEIFIFSFPALFFRAGPPT
jgi:carbohydrate diacid regulator